MEFTRGLVPGPRPRVQGALLARPPGSEHDTAKACAAWPFFVLSCLELLSLGLCRSLAIPPFAVSKRDVQPLQAVTSRRLVLDLPTSCPLRKHFQRAPFGSDIGRMTL